MTDNAGRLTGNMLQIVIVCYLKGGVEAIMESDGITDILWYIETLQDDGADFTMTDS